MRQLDKSLNTRIDYTHSIYSFGHSLDTLIGYTHGIALSRFDNTLPPHGNALSRFDNTLTPHGNALSGFDNSLAPHGNAPNKVPALSFRSKSYVARREDIVDQKK